MKSSKPHRAAGVKAMANTVTYGPMAWDAKKLLEYQAIRRGTELAYLGHPSWHEAALQWFFQNVQLGHIEDKKSLWQKIRLFLFKHL